MGSPKLSWSTVDTISRVGNLTGERLMMVCVCVCVCVCVWGWLNVTYAPDMTGRGHWENSQPISTQKKKYLALFTIAWEGKITHVGTNESEFSLLSEDCGGQNNETLDGASRREVNSVCVCVCLSERVSQLFPPSSIIIIDATSHLALEKTCLEALTRMASCTFMTSFGCLQIYRQLIKAEPLTKGVNVLWSSQPAD